MTVRIQIQGLNEVNKRMKSLLREVKSSPPSMKKIGLLGIRDVVNHFNQSMGPDGKWEGITHRKGKPLMDTGLLRTSTRFKVGSNNVMLFNNTKYGKYHQRGQGVKERKWMWISPGAQDRMTNVYIQMLMMSYK